MSPHPSLTWPAACTAARRTPEPGFSPLRSIGLAAAIALHLGLALLLAMPIRAPLPLATALPVPITLEPVIPPPPPIPPPPARVTPAPRPSTDTVPRVPVQAPVEPSASIALEPSPLDHAMADAPEEQGPVVSPGPALAQLDLRSGPAPRYPREALRRRLEGEVELLILVGEDGRPQTVSIARSSGHAVLDRAARDHVLRRWVFEPARREGVAVPAYARVPLRFVLPG